MARPIPFPLNPSRTMMCPSQPVLPNRIAEPIPTIFVPTLAFTGVQNGAET